MQLIKIKIITIIKIKKYNFARRPHGGAAAAPARRVNITDVNDNTLPGARTAAPARRDKITDVKNNTFQKIIRILWGAFIFDHTSKTEKTNSLGESSLG